MSRTFWFPYKPCTVAEAVNAHAAATGSTKYAAQTEHASFNGHRLGMSFNERRQYWIAQYIWAGRNVVSRGSFDEVLKSATSFFSRDGKQSSLVVTCLTQEQADKCLSIGMVPYSVEAEKAAFESYAWWGSEVSNAFWLQNHFGVPAINALVTSSSVAEYRAKLENLDLRNGNKNAAQEPA